MKLAILDRDGTLGAAGQEGGAPWAALPGALEAVARLNRAGWHVVLATNQPGLALGEFGMAELNALHAGLHRALGAAGARIEAVFYCPHGPEEGCGCRQPAPGLLQQIGERYGAEPQQTWVIGSCAEHLQAGAQVGAHLHLVCAQTAAALLDGQALPAHFPPQVRVHTSLELLVTSLLPDDTQPPA